MRFHFLLSLVAVFLLATLASADRRHEQSGEIKLSKPKSEVSPYHKSQDAAVELFDDLQVIVAGLKGGTIKDAPVLDGDALTFLAATYLHCSIQKGVCQYILDALLEADIINAKQGDANKCPNMKGFWKAWLKADMEKRHQYAVKTGYLHSTQAFNRDTRPKYIKCDDTVAAEIAGPASSSEYFKQRYTNKPEIEESIRETRAILKFIKDKRINIFGAVGIRQY